MELLDGIQNPTAKDFEAYGYPGVAADYRRTVAILRGLDFDLDHGGHPHQVRDEMRADGNPFVTREEWLKLLDGRAGRMENFLSRFPQYAQR